MAGRSGEPPAKGSTGRRPSLVIISEPMVSSDAVQLKFVTGVGRALLPRFDVTIASACVSCAQPIFSARRSIEALV